MQATRFYDRAEVKDLLAYLRLLAHPEEPIALERVINTPPRGIGAGTLGALREYARARNVSVWAAVCAVAEPEAEAREAEDAPRLSKRAEAAVRGFHGVMRKLRACLQLGESVVEAAPHADRPDPDPGAVAGGPPLGSLPRLVRDVLQSSGYEEYLLGGGVDDGDARHRNARELANLAARYSASQLQPFLDEAALVQDQDALAAAEAQEGGRAAASARPGRVSLLTAHAAKGLEFDVCVVLGVEEGLLPHSLVAEAGAPARSVPGLTGQRGADAARLDEEVAAARELAEERRLLYVAMTRARRQLYLCHARRRLVWGVARQHEPSRFLADVPPHLLDFIDATADHAGQQGADEHDYCRDHEL